MTDASEGVKPPVSEEYFRHLVQRVDGSVELVLHRYHQEYPDSVAFSDPASGLGERTLALRIQEFHLEEELKTLQAMVEKRVAERKDSWDACGISSSELHAHDGLSLRRLRQQSVDEVESIPTISPVVPDIDRKLAEIRMAGDPEAITLSSLSLHALHAAYAEAQIALQKLRLRHRLLLSASTEESVEIDPVFAYFHHFYSTKVAALSEMLEIGRFDSAECAKLVVARLAYSAQTQRKYERLTTRIRNIPHTHRYQIIKGAVEMHKKAERATQEELDLFQPLDDSDSNDGSLSPSLSPSKVPLMMTDEDDLDRDLGDLMATFGLESVDCEADYSQELFYHVNKRLGALFEEQRKATTFSPYPAFPASSHSLSPSSGPSPDLLGLPNLSLSPSLSLSPPSAAAVYLKDAKWLPFVRLQPRIRPAQQRFSLVRGSAAAGNTTTPTPSAPTGTTPSNNSSPISAVLRAEMAFLGATDVAYATGRMREGVEGFFKRAQVHEARFREVVAEKFQGIFTSTQGHDDDPTTRGERDRHTHTAAQPKEGGLPFTRHKMLALTYLRYGRCREWRRMLLGVLNYFRAVQRKLAVEEWQWREGDGEKDEDTGVNGTKGFSSPTTSTHPRGVNSLSPSSVKRGERERERGRDGGEMYEVSPMLAEIYDVKPADVNAKRREREIEELLMDDGGEDKFERHSDGRDIIIDHNGHSILYSVALTDMEGLEMEMLRIGSFYLEKWEHSRELQEQMSTANRKLSALSTADPAAIISDLLEHECLFQLAKRNVLDLFLAVHALTPEPTAMAHLRQTMTDIIARRPCLDAGSVYFTDAYVAEIHELELMRKVIQAVLLAVLRDDRRYRSVHAQGMTATLNASSEAPLTETVLETLLSQPRASSLSPSLSLSLSPSPSTDHTYTFQSSPSAPYIGLFDLSRAAGMIHSLPTLIESASEMIISSANLITLRSPGVVYVYQSVAEIAYIEWKLLEDEDVVRGEYLERERERGRERESGGVEVEIREKGEGFSMLCPEVVALLVEREREREKEQERERLSSSQSARSQRDRMREREKEKEKEKQEETDSEKDKDGGIEGERQWWRNAALALYTRLHLVDFTYETEILRRVLDFQMGTVEEPASQSAQTDGTTRPLTSLALATYLSSPPLSLSTPTFPSELLSNISLNDLDESLSQQLNLNGISGVERVLKGNALRVLQTALQCQVADRNIFQIITSYNEKLLDCAFRIALFSEECSFLETKAGRMTLFDVEGLSTLPPEELSTRSTSLSRCFSPTKLHTEQCELLQKIITREIWTRRRVKVRRDIQGHVAERSGAIIRSGGGDRERERERDRGVRKSQGEIGRELAEMRMDVLRGGMEAWMSEWTEETLRVEIGGNYEELMRLVEDMGEREKEREREAPIPFVRLHGARDMLYLPVPYIDESILIRWLRHGAKSQADSSTYRIHEQNLRNTLSLQSASGGGEREKERGASGGGERERLAKNGSRSSVVEAEESAGPPTMLGNAGRLVTIWGIPSFVEIFTWMAKTSDSVREESRHRVLREIFEISSRILEVFVMLQTQARLQSIHPGERERDGERERGKGLSAHAGRADLETFLTEIGKWQAETVVTSQTNLQVDHVIQSLQQKSRVLTLRMAYVLRQLVARFQAKENYGAMGASVSALQWLTDSVYIHPSAQIPGFCRITSNTSLETQWPPPCMYDIDGRRCRNPYIDATAIDHAVDSHFYSVKPSENHEEGDRSELQGASVTQSQASLAVVETNYHLLYLNVSVDQQVERLHRIALLPQKLSEIERNMYSGIEVDLDLLIDDHLTEKKVYSSTRSGDVNAAKLDLLALLWRVQSMRMFFLLSYMKSVDAKATAMDMHSSKCKELYKQFVLDDVVKEMPVAGPYIELIVASDAELGAIDGQHLLELQRGTVQKPSEFDLRMTEWMVLKRRLELMFIQHQKDVVMKWIVDTKPSRSDASPWFDGVSKSGIDEFMKLFYAHSRVQTDDRTKEPSYTILEKHLLRNLDVLCVSHGEWRKRVVAGLTATLRHVRAQYNRQMFVLEQNLANSNRQLELMQRSLAQRVQSAVLEKYYEMVHQADVQAGKIRNLEQTMAEQEETVRSKVRDEYDDLVRDLTTQLMQLKAQFQQYRSTLFREVRGNLEEVKKEAMLRMVESDNTPLELKKKALKFTRFEDEINALKERNAELEEYVTKLKVLYGLRFVTVRSSYRKQLQDSIDNKTKSSVAYWSNRQHVEEQEKNLRSRLIQAQSGLEQAEAEKEQLKKELKMHMQTKQQLLQWKLKNSVVLDDLKEKMRKFEKYASYDLDKVIYEYEHNRADRTRPGTSSRFSESRQSLGTSMSRTSSVKEVDRLKRELAKERKLKQEVMDKLQRLRLEGDSPASPQVRMDRSRPSTEPFQTPLKQSASSSKLASVPRPSTAPKNYDI